MHRSALAHMEPYASCHSIIRNDGDGAGDGDDDDDVDDYEIDGCNDSVALGQPTVLTQAVSVSQSQSPPHAWQSIPSPAASVVQSTQSTVLMTQDSDGPRECNPAACGSVQGGESCVSQVQVADPTRVTPWYEDDAVLRVLCSTQYECLCARLAESDVGVRDLLE